MTNNEIVKDIQSQVMKLIVANIHKSKLDQSHKDLHQYICEKLLQMDNLRLNLLYDNEKLFPFVSQIIKNQRNYYRSQYNLTKVQPHIQPEDILYTRYEPYEHPDYEERLEIEQKNFEKYKKTVEILRNPTFGWTGRTQMELEHDLCIAILSTFLGIEIINDEIFFKKKSSIREMSNQFVRKLKSGKEKRVEKRLISRYINRGFEIVRKEVNGK